MKKTLFLLLVLLIAYCFISCKKECFCKLNVEETYDDDQHLPVYTHYSESVPLGQLSDTDCKNWEGYTYTDRTNEEYGLTAYLTYTECSLQ